MKKLIKRADGSKSPRGLWDNIRANKGSGKKPTKEMLKQEAKIKKEENMKEYKKGGKKNSAKIMKEAKREKESFIQESKELKFGAPSSKSSMKEIKKYENGGPKNENSTEGSYKSKSKEITPNGNYAIIRKIKEGNGENSESEKIRRTFKGVLRGAPSVKNAPQNPKFQEPSKLEKSGEIEMKKGGKKTMEPGGGGRFAKLVNKMKGQGKSEESAKAIAASIGRKKYGKSKFQAMAAAGKMKMGGKKNC